MSGVSGPAEPGSAAAGIKNTGICLAWIAVLFLVGGLSWFFTRSVRETVLMRAVNRVLLTMQDPRRFRRPLPSSEIPPGGERLGSWYDLADSPGRGLVFSIMNDGISVSYAVIISGQGKVEDLIPLNGHGSGILERLPPGVLRAHIRRIEGGR
jgi:hypothetical protein